MVRWLVLLAICWMPSAAQAEWREAVSKHFIIYADAPEDELRKAATDLEKYDFLLRLMMGQTESSPLKLKIYLMRDTGEVRQTLGGKASGVAGYYNYSPRGSIAVGIVNDTGGTKYDMSSQVVLFHEYAHHLMLQNSKAAYPPWYVEGFAEYYGTTRILPDNVFEMGIPPNHRRLIFHELDDWIPLNTLLTATSFRDLGNVGTEGALLYAQGWLLVHYLANNETRRGQLGRYLLAINRGMNRQEAVDNAFGKNASELNRELRTYSRRHRLDAVRITFPKIDVGSIELRTLREAERSMMLYDIALSRGVLARGAAEFIGEVRKDAARFGNDPYAAAILTDAEYLAGDRKSGAAAVDRWLAAEPRSPRAMMYKSLTAADALAKAGSTDAGAWQEARKWVTDARSLAPDDPLIMEAFYDAHAMQGTLPPARAQNALYRAMELVPQDYRLRYKVAADYERRGLIEAAIFAIQPAVYRAHRPEDESDKQKAKREKLEEKFRLAGHQDREKPEEMLRRLEAKFLAATQSASAKSATAATAEE